MRPDRFIDLMDLKSRYLDLMERQSRAGRMAIRLSFLALIALFLSTVVPTMAQDLGNTPLTPTGEIATPTTATPANPTDSPSAPAVDTGGVVIDPTPDLQISPTPVLLPAPIHTPISESPTASPTPVTALKVQPTYQSQVPSLINVDPRAVQGVLPGISFTGAKYTLACVSSDNLRLDILSRRAADGSPSKTLLVAGDLTGQLRVAGLTEEVLATLNSNGGLTAFSTQGGVAGKSLYIRYVATTGASTAIDLCAASQSGALVRFRALDLTLSNARGGVKLKR